MTRPDPTVTVPVEPTEAMLDAWHKATWPQGPRVSPLSQQGLSFARAYRAMLSAAPAAPQAAGVGEREAIARIMDPKGWETRDRQYDAIKRSTMHDKDRPLAFANADYYTRDSLTKADAILALRAPSREPEGGAVDDGAFKIATDLHKAYEQLIYGLPRYLDAENLTDEENMIREAWVTLDVTAHRLAALATREEAPAEAGERDYPAEFEAWWATYRHRNRDVADYPVKKQIAFDAFYFAALRAPSREPEGGAVWGAAIEAAAKTVERQIPNAAGGPMSHTNTARVFLFDAVKAIRALATREVATADHVSDARQMVEAPAEAGERECGWCDGRKTKQTPSTDFTIPCPYCKGTGKEALRAQPQAREDAQPVWGYAYRQAEFGGVTITPKPEWRLWPMTTDVDRRCIEDMRSQGSRYDLQPLYTHPAPDALRVAVEASGFLLDRLKDLEQDVNERDFYGHVHPAAARLRLAIAALQAEQGAK